MPLNLIYELIKISEPGSLGPIWPEPRGGLGVLIAHWGWLSWPLYGGWPMFISFLKDFRRLRVVIQKWIGMHISYFLIHVWLRLCDTSKYPAHYVALNFEGSWCERNGEMGSAWCAKIHDDFMKWKHFRRNWPFVRGIHRSPVNSSHKGQWRGALIFSVICAWINGWLNNGEAGVYRYHCAHYGVIVMVQGERFNVNYQRQFHVE